MLNKSQYPRHRIRHRLKVGDRSEVEKPDPIRKLVSKSGGDLDRQAGLAHPTRTGQGHQPMRLQYLLELADLCLAPDEARARRPQISRVAIQSPQRRELSRQPVSANLEDLDGLADVPQPP